MTHVFISYVKENAKLASWIAKQIRLNGIEPWFSDDAGRISTGDNWQRVLRSAIQNGGYYLPIYTKEWSARSRSVANQELMIAAEEARLRPLGRRWIIPLKVDDADLPEIHLGGGVSLSDIHYADVSRLGWERALTDILQSLGVENPIIDHGEPLAPGFGTNAKVTHGFVTYRNLSIPIPELDRVSFTVTGGYISRNESGNMVAQFLLRAPFEELQHINESLGLDRIDVLSVDNSISNDPTKPTTFMYIDEMDMRDAGSPIWRLGQDEKIFTSRPMQQESGYNAVGYITEDNEIIGKFDGFVKSTTDLGQEIFEFSGDFRIGIAPLFSAPL